MKKFVFFVLSSLLVLTPFVFSPRSSELFEFPKLLIIYFGASLLFPLLVFNLNKFKRKFGQNKNRFERLAFFAIVIFFVSQLVSTWLSIDSHVSFFGYYSRFNGGLLSLISYLTIFFSAVLFLNRDRVEKLLKIAVFSGLFVALWGLPSHFGHDFICLLVTNRLDTSCWTADFVPQLRLFSTLGQPNWFATYLLVLISIVLYFFTTSQSLLPKKLKQYSTKFATLLIILFSVELIWTNSRSGLVAYIVIMLLFFSTYFLTQKKSFLNLLKQTFYLPLMTLILVILVSAWSIAVPRLQAVFQPKPALEKTSSQTASQKPQEELKITPSSQIRLVVWQGAWQLAQEYPLFGTGVETFAYGYNFTRPQSHNLTSEWNYVYNKAHNELLNYLATTGWVGLISYLILFGVFLLPAILILLNRSKASSDHWHFSLFYLLAMISIFLMNIFGFSTTVTNLFYYLLPALLLTFLADSNSNEQAVKERSLTQQLGFGQVSLYFVWLLFSFVYLLNYFTADFHYARAREYKQVQDFTNAYISGQKALDLRREPTYLDQQAGIAANLAALQQIQRNSPQAKQFSQQAIDYNNETLSSSTKNVFYYKTRAKVFYALSMSYVDDPTLSSEYLFKAVQALETASLLAPTDPIIPFTLAGLIQSSEPDKALDLLQLTVSLKPDYSEASSLIKQLQNSVEN